MFWANAVVLNEKSNKVYSLSTYEGSDSLGDAKSVIDEWKKIDSRKVLCAYVTGDTSQEILYLENNIDSFGNIRYTDNNDKCRKIGQKKASQ